MGWKAKWKESRPGSLTGAAVATVLGLGFLFYTKALTNLSYDLPYAFRPSVQPTHLGDVVIIYMDERSQNELRQTAFINWDRRIHAALLEQLQRYSVPVVAFDVLFDSTTASDAALVEAVEAHGKVVVGARHTPARPGEIRGFEGVGPFDELDRVALQGITEVSVDRDGVVRQHYSGDWHSTNLASFASRVLQLSAVAPVPAPGAFRYLNYYGPPLTIPSVSYVDVLSNRVELSVLSNKVAFVGGLVETPTREGKEVDEHPTPWLRKTTAAAGPTRTKSPGVEINATAYLNLARGDWLIQLSPVKEFLIILGIGCLSGLGLGLLRPVTVMLVATISVLLIFSIACLVVWHERIWFVWAIPCFVQFPAAAICSVVLRAQKLHWEKEVLEEKLATAVSPIGGTPLPQAPGRRPARPHTAAAVEAMRQQLQERMPSPFPVDADSPTILTPSPQQPVIPDCTLLRRIGAGAYGEVWLGTTVLGHFRAIKIVYRRSFRDDRPFDREFEGIKFFDPISRSHPGLVHLLHVGRNEAAGYFYYLMELADDASGSQPFSVERYEPKTLTTELNQRGRLNLEECVQLGLALTESLDYLHGHQLIHRDLKPSNIIFVEGKPKLADIGLVTQIGDSLSFVGTEGYYPPEGPGSPAGDLYSLGKVLYETLTGLNRRQFPELPTSVSTAGERDRLRGFNKILMRACQNNVDKRYATAAAMRQDILNLSRKRTGLRDLFQRNPTTKPQP